MAKVTAYMSVAKAPKSYQVAAHNKPHPAPLSSNSKKLPTAHFAIELDIPDSMFHQAEQVVAQVNVNHSQVAVPVVELAGCPECGSEFSPAAIGDYVCQDCRKALG